MLKQGVILAAGQGGTISSTDLGIFSWDLFNFWSVINNILKYLTLFWTSFIRFRRGHRRAKSLFCVLRQNISFNLDLIRAKCQNLETPFTLSRAKVPIFGIFKQSS